MRGKARDILILWRITDFSTTGSVGLKRRNNERQLTTLDVQMINIHHVTFYVKKKFTDQMN